jgi:dolichol-phosphate mannosyltransferase
VDAKPRTVSVILPAYNEASNLRYVVSELEPVLQQVASEHEILVVDDGSTDNTVEVLAQLTAEFPRLRSAHFRSNRGKSAAVQAGLELVTGEVVVLMDADGQDNPAELPALIGELESGSDMVTGSRVHNRHDRFVKRSTSRVYNWASRKLTGLDVHDMNSGFKAMNAGVAGDIMVYGELHRYLPVLASWAGYRVSEVPVVHRDRHSGESKFGFARFWRGMLDLLTVRFLSAYTTRPFHLFGGLGFAVGAIGMGLLGWMLMLQVFGDEPIGNRPALIAGVMMVLVSIQLFSIGLIGELIVNSAQRTQRSAGQRTRSAVAGVRLVGSPSPLGGDPVGDVVDATVDTAVELSVRSEVEST